MEPMMFDGVECPDCGSDTELYRMIWVTDDGDWANPKQGEVSLKVQDEAGTRGSPSGEISLYFCASCECYFLNRGN